MRGRGFRRVGTGGVIQRDTIQSTGVGYSGSHGTGTPAGLGAVVSTGVGTAFNPALLSGLLLWVDNTSSITSSGSPAAVDQWNDLSGNANHLVGVTNTRPILVASDSDLGGVRTINCSTGVGPFSHKGLKGAGLVYGPFTKFFVVGGHVTGAGYFDYHYTGASSGDFVYSSTNGITVIRSSVQSDRNPGALWGNYGATTFKTQRHEFNGTHASHKFYLNGVDQGAADGPNVANPGSGTLTEDWFLGVDSSLGTSTGSKWAAVLIYNRLLTPTESGNVENWLKAKFGHY